jgi:thymidylate synthase (FAD)
MDILQNHPFHVQIGKSSVSLIDCSPRICPEGRTCDYAIIRSARASYDQGLKTIKEDNALLNYLMRNHHTSPFEFVTFTFRIECPIFVARQLMRHRTFSFNEKSLRYVEAQEDEFYIPDVLRKQDSNISNQSSSETETVNNPELIDKYNECVQSCYKLYKTMISAGVCREQARMVLPLSTMTTIYAQNDLNNLLKFLQLRMDIHAQAEIRWIAKAIYDLIQPLVPQTMQAYNDYIINTITFTDKEITKKDQLTKREKREYDEKIHKIAREYDEKINYIV